MFQFLVQFHPLHSPRAIFIQLCPLHSPRAILEERPPATNHKKHAGAVENRSAAGRGRPMECKIHEVMAFEAVFQWWKRGKKRSPVKFLEN
jgi:hypothetical protein